MIRQNAPRVNIASFRFKYIQQLVAKSFHSLPRSANKRLMQITRRRDVEKTPIARAMRRTVPRKSALLAPSEKLILLR
jgi:hypothetical protein